MASPNILTRIINSIVRSLEILLIFIMGILVIDVVWQVFTRYVLHRSSSWTEELATMLLIWVSLIGAAVGFIRKGHLGIDYLANKLETKSRALLDIAVYAIVGLFAGLVMIQGGMILVSKTLSLHQVTPSLQIERGYVYTVVPFSGVCITIYSLSMIIQNICALITKKPDK